MSSNGVLVLNDNYQPLNVTNARRAIGLLCVGKAHVVEADSKVFRSERIAIELPTVVRLNHHVRRPTPVLRVSRKSIFARDHYTCQYCGAHSVPLTIDHVVPRERGGGDDWTNLLCCCTKCNNKKGNRMPEEAGMRMRRLPFRPKYLPYISYTKFLAAAANPAWRPYLAPYADMRSLRASA
ncbi:MAG TPA: HNH endonuclease [Armatimonadota bacterium]|nr:HNH endonuclease [Armatimonadota bacterium]